MPASVFWISRKVKFSSEDIMVVRRVDLFGLQDMAVVEVGAGAVNMIVPGESGLMPRVLSISSIVGEVVECLVWVEGGDSYTGIDIEGLLDRSGEAELMTALILGFGISWKGSVIPAPDMMSSLLGECRLVTTMVVLARSESSDISWGEFLVLANSRLGELVALLLAFLTGVLVANLELMKSSFIFLNSSCMFSLTALMRGERMVLISAGMMLLEVVGILLLSSGGSIIDTPDKSHRPSSCNLYLLEVEVTGLDVIIRGVAKVFILISPLALLPGVPIVELRVLLNPDLIILDGVSVCMVWFTCCGVEGIPRAWVLFLAVEALQESSR